MQYRETLPPDCPPPDASAIMERTVRYRLLESTTPMQEDFDSFVKKRGKAMTRSRRTPCEQSGVSLFKSLDSARALLNSDLNKNSRWESIGELAIPTGAGKLNPVERDGHQTWWPSRAFNPVKNCRVVP